MRWWRRLSLRGRLILIGVVGLAVGLGLGGGLLVYGLNATLVRALDSTAVQSANEVAALVRADRLVDPIPAGQGGAVIQVVDAHDRIVAASVGADRLVPVLHGDELRAARAGERTYVPGDRAGLPGLLRVVGVPVGDRTVLVAVPAGELTQTVRLMRNVLLVAYPLIVAVLGVVAWRAVGWTLRPVESLRRGADAIANSGSAAARLPVPTGTDEVARLATTLNGMLAKLEAGQDRQRAFVADAAHELRSPVASIRTQLEVAQRLGDRADWPDVAADVLADTERLSRLTEDLLLLARTGDTDEAAARLARRRERLDLGLLLTELAERYADARVPVRVTTDRPVWTDGDPEALGRVVANLVDNAVRHAATEVTLAASTVDGEATVVVADDGPGIPVPDRERVFDRFTRLDNARARDEGGSGLGLAIVADLVRLHHGTITLAAAHHRDPNTGGRGGPGVRAEIRLPLAEPPSHD
ncbi:MAG TPA: HAMP domain-containing sensor histidine kinase [Actinocatenispora sp.]